MRGCSVEGCELVHRAHGFCNTHYQRWLKRGDPLCEVQLRAPDSVRFWNKVERGGIDECWHWKIKKGQNAYGQFRSKDLGRPMGAHSFSFYLANGYIAEETMHTCDVRSCVNPRHLVAGSRSLNMQDMIAKGRHSTIRALGEAHHGAKLTADDIRTIRSSPESLSTLGERYGVNKTTISGIKSRKSWKHID